MRLFSFVVFSLFFAKTHQNGAGPNPACYDYYDENEENPVIHEMDDRTFCACHRYQHSDCFPAGTEFPPNTTVTRVSAGSTDNPTSCTQVWGVTAEGEQVCIPECKLYNYWRAFEDYEGEWPNVPDWPWPEWLLVPTGTMVEISISPHVEVFTSFMGWFI